MTLLHMLSIRNRPNSVTRPLPSRGLLALVLILGVLPLHAQESRDLALLSVTDLLNVEVTSVSRKGQKLSETAAAVFVITQDEIRASGASTVPEVLRMVPGLDVARVNGNVWAISARGNNGQFANKLLVMIDGRSVYTPLFSGVFWDVQDTLLSDIDRIEVIRGPGGTLWGANAVNGIINIITKHAVDTIGIVATAGAGSEGTLAEGRYGASFGPNGNFRVYGKSFDRPASTGGAHRSNDAWTMGRGGFRADWTSRAGDSFTAQGDIYRGTATTLGKFDPSNPGEDRSSLNHLAGNDLQFRWTATQSSRSDTSLQAFYDYTARVMPSFSLSRHALDVEFQQHLKLGKWNDVVWGVAYRRTTDKASGPVIRLVRRSTIDTLASAFIQDEFQISPRVRVTAGAKALYEAGQSPFLQPTLRLLFKATDRQSIWAAVTSAVRLPSEIEEDARVNVGAFPDGSAHGGLIILTGNPSLAPERVRSMEIGYRIHISDSRSFDATAFHNSMQDLVISAPSAPIRDSSGQNVIPIRFANTGRGRADGVEFLLADSLAANWDVSLGYAFFKSTWLIAGTPTPEVSSPRHQLQLRSSIRLPRELELDSSAYYVGSLGTAIPAYLRFDAQLSWSPSRRWTLSASGQNLTKARHGEFAGTNGELELTAPIRRTVNGKVTWRF